MPWDLRKTFISALQHGVEETLRDSFLFFPANITDYLSVACGLYLCQERIRSDFYRLLLSSEELKPGMTRGKNGKMGDFIDTFLQPQRQCNTTYFCNNNNKNNRVGKAGMPLCLAKVLLLTHYLNFPNTTDLSEVLCKMLLVLSPEELLEVSVLNV